MHFLMHKFVGKGQNVKNQSVKSQKEHQKFEKDQNVESIFKIDQNVKNQNVEKKLSTF